jgi:hypothetical protein
MPISSDLPAPLSFGVGCFAFETVATTEPRVVKFEEWRAGVEAALANIPSVEQVEVTFDSNEVVADWWLVAATPDPDEAPWTQGFEPDLRGARVTFEVSIPHRLHSELLGGDSPHSGERFRVETVYEFHGPCTFVTCLDSQGSGSEAVRLLWNFLRREIPRASADITFTLVGPSPMHADFTLAPVDAEGDDSPPSFRLGGREPVWIR